MKVNYVLMYGTPYLKYREFETFEDVSKFLVNKSIVNYSIFKKLEDKEEVEMIYRDNDIRYLEQENKQLKDKIEKLKDYGEKVGERRNQLYDKIDKAIEYIRETGLYCDYGDLCNQSATELLEILGDKE